MKRRATKILTVVSLAAASAAPASASPGVPARWAGTGDAKITAVVLENEPYMVRAASAPVRITWQEYGRFLGETGPLVGPDGRPGCGNTLGKAASTCEPARAKALEARKIAAKKTNS
jgi:hypothetical protein